MRSTYDQVAGTYEALFLDELAGSHAIQSATNRLYIEAVLAP